MGQICIFNLVKQTTLMKLKLLIISLFFGYSAFCQHKYILRAVTDPNAASKSFVTSSIQALIDGHPAPSSFLNIVDTTVTPTTNLFDGAVTYGSYYVTSTGLIGSAAGWARSTNKIAVSGSTTYSTAGSGNISDYLVEYDASNNYLGYATYSATTGGLKFTTRANTAKIGITFTSTGQTGFETSFQLNVGSAPVTYQPPNTVYYDYNVRPAFLGRYYSQTDVNNKLQLSLKVIKTGDVLYLRSPFSATNDLLQRLSLNVPPVAFNGVFLIPVATTDANIPAVLTNMVHSTLDDIAPANYNGTYIGGGHGGFFVSEITSEAHGKTSSDIGSSWLDATGRTFYIMKIVDANKLWVISNNTGSGDLWSFKLTASAPLTYVTGGVHTSSIAISSQTQQQLKPSYQNEVEKLFADGMEVTADGTYRCSEFTIQNTYNIPNIPDVISYVAANHVADFVNASIPKSAAMSVAYTFNKYGGTTITHSFTNYKAINMNYVGFIQAFCLNDVPDSRKLYRLIPDVLPFTGAIKTWNYANIEDITGDLIDDFLVTSAYFKTAGKPPYRYVEMLKDSVNSGIINFSQGYSPINGVTALGVRGSYTNTAMDVYSSRKMYPHALNSVLNAPTVPANSYFNGIAFKSYTNPATNPNAVNVAFYKDADAWVVLIDYNQVVTLDRIVLPVELSGSKITVVEKTSNVTVHSTVVDNSNVIISVNNTISPVVGYAVLKLTKQ